MELTILFVGFAILLVLGAPITFAMAIPCAFAFMLSPNLPSLAVCQKLFSACDSFSLMAMPFFMLAGGLMNEIGITSRIVKFANSLVGHIRGGLAHTTSLAGMIMAGISGSANADAAALGGLLLSPLILAAGFRFLPCAPEMEKLSILVMAMPVAMNTFPMASAMGMDGDYAAKTIMVSTMLSVLTLPLVIEFLIR